MPGGDRTGPAGQGPATGRRLGYCVGYETPGYTGEFEPLRGRSFAYGMGRGPATRPGRGGGRGWRWQFCKLPPRYYSGHPWMRPLSKEEEAELLRGQAEEMKLAQKDIEKRINELENEDDSGDKQSESGINS